MLRRVVPRLGTSIARRNIGALHQIPKTSFSKYANIVPGSADEFRSTDGYFETCKVADDVADPTGRTHQYVVMGGARVMYASLARVAVVKVVGSLSASADVLALGTVEVDMSGIAPGTGATVKWRGKPVFVRNRTEEEIAKARADDGADLRDPETDAERCQDPNWMIVLGICTHLGCVPTANAGDYGAWFCPCHGSHYDLAGRIRKGPAPLNLEVPEYSIAGMTLKLGS